MIINTLYHQLPQPPPVCTLLALSCCFVASHLDNKLRVYVLCVFIVGDNACSVVDSCEARRSPSHEFVLGQVKT